jgi:hypothetical protein
MDTVDDKKRRKPGKPEGYQSTAAFLSEMRQRYDRAYDADVHNRIAAQEDIDFTFGEQWDPTARKRRERAKKPVLTINRLPAYVAQIVNNRLLNETEIRVLPDHDGTKEIAELRQGIIKAIFKNSESDFARDEAMKYQVICGMGAFHLSLEYNSDEAVNDQDIHIKPIADPMAVVFDEMSVAPDGGDANHAFVVEDLPLDIFKARYPWAATSSFDPGFRNSSTVWYSDNSIKVVSYWRMVDRGVRILALLTDGSTKDLADQIPDGMDRDEFIMQATLQGIIARRGDGEPYVRIVPKRVAEMYLCSGGDILEGPYRLPISSIPVYRVPGWELRNGNRVQRWGLVRFLKDPQRLHNYWRSVIAEQLVAAPRNKWVATRDAISGHEKEWKTSHISDDPLLMYNAEGGKPERIAPPPADAGLLTEAANTVQDIRDVSNIHEAALGMKSNEVSGKAITARQQMTDLASYIYHDRLRLAEERCAKNINELIPVVYDTTRIVTIFGQDDKAVQAVINDPSDPNTDVTLGKYGITVTTGPATITKRALAAEQMMAFVNAVPESASMVMDLVAEAQDWPKASEFARRFKAMLPPNLSDPAEMTPEQQQQQMQQAEEAQVVKQIELQKALAEIETMKAQAAERMARAQQLQANAYKLVSDAEARQDDVEGKNLERDAKARMKVVETAIQADMMGNEESNNDD